MHWSNVVAMMGGLSLFLYGMHVMSEGLELLAGSKLKSILERLTRNRFMAMLVGLVLTAFIHSSNAVTSMTVGFVNAGLMDFSRAIGVIMGANIGTTVTGQMIAINATQFAGIFTFIGVIMLLFFKKKRVQYLGQVLAGAGILFIGMEMLSTAMAPLRDSAWFQQAVVSFKNPFVGILVGTLFTMIVQSGSASIGVIQALALQGLIGLDSAVYVLCGNNIGCTVAAIVASIGGRKDAKRTAVVHLLFNVISALLVLIVCQVTPFVAWMEGITPNNIAAQIANTDTFFNALTVAILLPTSGLMASFAKVLVPGEDDPISGTPELLHIQPNIGSPSVGVASIGVSQVGAEIARMEQLARDNLDMAMRALFEKGIAMDNLAKNEETIDFLNSAISGALVQLSSYGLSQQDAEKVRGMYHVISDLERIGDHAENIAGYAQTIHEHKTGFSEMAGEELRGLSQRVFDILDASFARFTSRDAHSLDGIERMEQEIDDMTDALQDAHIARLEANACSADIGLLFVEILNDLERVADHALNIAEAA